MKSIFFRLSRDATMYFIVLIVVGFVFIFSINDYKNSYESQLRWGYNIMDYSMGGVSIEKQIEANEQMISGELSESELEYVERIKHSNDILRFLRENNYSYDEVFDGELMIHEERSRWVYTANIFDALIWVNMFISIVLLLQIVCSGKNNGAFACEILMSGRKKLFFEQLGAGAVMIFLSWLVESALILACRPRFADSMKYLIYYNSGDIMAVPEWLESLGLAFFALFESLFFYLILFSTTQLINNSIITLFVMAIFAGIVYKSTEWLPRTGIVKVFTSATVYSPLIGVSVGFSIFVKFLKLIFVCLIVLATFLIINRRRLRTKYT